MRKLSHVGLILLLVVLVAPAPRAQQPPAAGTMSIDDIVDRIAKSESALTTRMRTYHPIVEVYIQDFKADSKLGTVPVKDEYFLGQFDGTGEGPRLLPLSPREGSFRTPSLFKRPFDAQYQPDGFAATTAPDWQMFNRERYEFTFVRREFLGEARTLVFDVRPKSADTDGFSGRLWVEDRDFNIVRFNGVSRNVALSSYFQKSIPRHFNGISRNVDGTPASFQRKSVPFHVDSWRVNVSPGVWLPSYVYCEESDPNDSGDKPTAPRQPRIKSQVRLWGYELKGVETQQELATIQIDGPIVQDTAADAQQLAPVLSQRRWEQQAEENVLDRLSRAGLLAPAGPVDAVLETVLNNLEVTNNITPDRPTHVRILLTSPLESFTVGHTIVVSRGLIDVLPDEASLAMVLGYELSHVILGHQLVDTKFAFADRLMIPDPDLLKTLRFRHSAAEEAAANVRVVELLKNSPYKDKLAAAGLFLRTIAANAKLLPNLIQPRMGDYVVNNKQSLTTLMQSAPELARENLDQVSALPLGARLIVDPWSDRLELIRTSAVPLASPREKLPLLVTPLMPYIRYAEAPVDISSR